MLDETVFDTMFTDGLRRSAYRWEALPAYEVDSDKGPDGSDYQRYLAGEAEASREIMQSWLEQLRSDKARGVYRHRVRMMHNPLHPYERYECEWGYALTGRLDHDYWILDDEHAIRMHYADDCQYLGGSLEPELPPLYREARDLAWAAAEPFDSWWARHPEHHRANQS